MKPRELALQRLTNLHVAGSRCTSAQQVVRALGAMQAQDHAGGLWAIGLRLPGAKLADVEAALERREIVRSWPLRGTLHFVPAEDLGWMLDLLAERVLAKMARRRAELALDDATLRKVERLLPKALASGPQTREQLREALVRAGISPEGGRLYHCLVHFALRQQLCFATHAGKQPRFAGFDDWLPSSRRLARDEALGELCTRYFVGHGPATQQDVMRWAGLTAAEAKAGIASARGLTELVVDGARYWTARDQLVPPASARQTFLLPGFDEYMLGYRDRSAMLDDGHKAKIVPGDNGVFKPTIVHDGKVVGVWSAVARKSVRLGATRFVAASAAQERAFARAGAAYAAFLGQPLAR